MSIIGIVGVAAGAIFLLLAIYLFASYVKASPNVALVVSGWPNKEPKFLIGEGGFRFPGLQKVDTLYLGQLSVDIKATRIPTKDFINVDVDAVAKVRVNPDENLIKLAAKNFVGKSANEIAIEIQDSLEGNMREIVGTQDLRSLNNDRDGFSNQIQEKAAFDMSKLGLEILTCNIQSITDESGLIHDMGADNTYSIKKDAAITKAKAERDIRVEQAKAAKEANDAEVESNTQIAEKQNELLIKKAELKRISDVQKAIADNAYKIQEQEQLKTVNVKTVEADSAKEIRYNEQQREILTLAVAARVAEKEEEQKLREQEINISQKVLEANVNKAADAEKYQKEIAAAAELEQRKRKAEAEAYEAEQRARAVKAKAEADLFAAKQDAAAIKAKYEAEAAGIELTGKAEAEAIKVKGEAEASAIEAKGLAEAAAMEKKADAYKKYNGAAMAEMVVNVLPEMAGKIAQPLSSIKDVHVFGTNGNESAGISGNVPVVMAQTMQTMKEATGVDLTRIMQENSKIIAASADLNK